MIGSVLLIVFGSVLLLPFTVFFLIVLMSVLSEMLKCDDNGDLSCIVTLMILTIAGAAMLWGGIATLPG